MRASRRDFIRAGCTAATGILTSTAAKSAWFTQQSSAIATGGRVTLNTPAGYANLVKGFGFQPVPGNQNSDGYPIISPNPALVAAASPSMPSNYWDEFVWKWSGTGSMYINAAPPMIISSSSSKGGRIPPTGDNFGGNIILTTVTSPRIQFLFGVLIQSLTDSGVSNGSGGTLIRVRTKANFAANIPAGTSVSISGITTQTNANGTWTVKLIGGNTSAFDLDGTTYSPARGPGDASGIAVLRGVGLSINIGNFSNSGSGSFSGFASLVWCKVANEAIVADGAIYDPVLKSQIQSLLNPNYLSAPNVWLRFMDFTGVQSSWECDFSQRIAPTQLSYNASYFRPGYWAAFITNGGSDNYTCSDPSSGGGIKVWNGTNYIDNGIVQGRIDATNAGGFPTLAVGGGPAKPIFTMGPPGNLGAYQFFANAAPSGAGQTLVFQLAAPWLNGGTPYNLSYTTTKGDIGDQATFNNNLATAFSSDTTIKTAGIQFGNPFASIYPRTAQAGRLLFSQTSGPSIVTILTMPSATLQAGNATFMYSYLLDGWIYAMGGHGLTMSSPLEAAVEIANSVNAHVWWNWGVTKEAFIVSVTNFFADKLNPQLRFGQEPWNEVWNFAAHPAYLLTTLGLSLGFPSSSNAAVYSFCAVRICQYAAIAKSAWKAAGRSANNIWILQPSATFDVGVNSNYDLAQLKGAHLNRTGKTIHGIPDNPIFGTYGGLNGSGSISKDYNIFPNRPVDITNATGCAPYWSSHWLGNGGSISDASAIVGTAAQNAPWLKAAKDYCSGSPAVAFVSMADQFTGATSGGTGNRGYNFQDMQKTFSKEEATCAQYDGSGRPPGTPDLIILDYEGGPSWGVGSNGINGINSMNPGDVSAIATRIVALGWNVSPYTISSANNATEMATMAVALFQGWKLDTDIDGKPVNSGSYKNMIKTYYYAARNQKNTEREAHAAQFNYSGPNQWCLFPGDYSGTQYTSYAALQEFNS